MFAACTHIVQSHLLFSAPGLTLEEHGFPVVALRTHVILRTRQCGVAHHIRVYVSQLVHFVHDFVHVHAVGVSQLLVITISTSIQKNFVVFVLARVKHVVAFLTKLYANVSRPAVFSCDIGHSECLSTSQLIDLKNVSRFNSINSVLRKSLNRHSIDPSDQCKQKS